MIDFMVVALPRSGTTWASNWLTTDTTLCLHDPLWHRHFDEWDAIQSTKSLGVSCTGIARFPEWLNQHPARKVILHRDLWEITCSLAEIGLPGLSPADDGLLDAVQGVHCHWQDIFTNPQPIYEFLLGKPFDAERHAELRQIEMQPNFAGLTINKNVTANLLKQLKE